MTIFDFIERFILFVIPGVIVYVEFSYLTGKRAPAEWLSLTYVFLASTLSFVFGNLLILAVNLLPQFEFSLVDIAKILSGDQESLSTAGLVFSIIAAVVLGLLTVFIWDKRYIFRLANWMHITHKTDNDQVWDYLFDFQPWVILRDYVTGNTYYGRVDRYSDGDGVREILLEEVSVWSKADGEYKMEKVYISRNPSEFTIEIDNYAKEREKDGSTKAKSGAKA